MKGYKIFNPDFTCIGYQFAENSEHKIEGAPSLCNHGFHFCEKASSLFSYYSFDPKNIVCEIEARGDIDTKDGENKHCTNHIWIGRRLAWEEVLKVANEGANNTGHSNTGDRNTGAWNTGAWNTGDRNTGDSNTGAWNTGDRNTGYRNTGDRNTGAFCTEDAPFPLFNKPSNWTEKEFINSRAYKLMQNNVDTKMWVPAHAMSDVEKDANRGWKTAEGYVKDIPFKEAFQNAWHNWSEVNREAFKELPNFSEEVFFEITGVKI